ncbi:efflux transporter, outer membrane factor (OMF) lipoprotein, NodT family [Raoultella planticola]|uniref:Efflux transporter, outer membrane factor (OMF) lipoprotein, NodT family n=1 Tax=Raoultella planticola TaxID=575 RepID=A0A485B4B8_RAOPL|nr:efflux transporter, outer membrane factor (OMF) lipoprotein, NodT family [Raoultella planticola]
MPVFSQLHEHYRDTVFQAAREVDDAAIAYANDKDEIVLLSQTGKAASRSLEIANTQYREGMADFQRVLDSQRALVQPTRTAGQQPRRGDARSDRAV